MINRLALGTAQFGLPYSIGSRQKNVGGEADTILNIAWLSGIDTLDTALSYGECEQLLGKIGVGQWQIISKLPAVPETCKDIVSWVEDSVADSLERLQVSKLYGLLLHHPAQLLGPCGEELYRALIAIQGQGTVEKLGISIYGPDELDAIWPRYQFDLVQIPFNVLDRRLISSGWLNQLHKAGKEVHVRSIFLQGLLLLVDATNLPEKFNRWQSLWDEWHCWLKDQALTPLQACIGFVASQSKVNRVVVGVDSLKHLQEILACNTKHFAVPPESLMSDDPDLINPSRWSLF
jgi:aryl-alcohol dehydrogenase-like predicted oxidoreductase